jgi:predicted transcriptional regulator
MMRSQVNSREKQGDYDGAGEGTERGLAPEDGVQTELGKRFAYTTVQTMLNKLCTKQRVQRIRNGRSYIYSPTISQEAAAQEALNILIDQFGLGSADNLVAAMIRVGLMTKVQLKNIVHVINGNI